MDSRNGPTADGGDADLLRISLLAPVRPVIGVCIGIIQSVVDAVRQRQRGPGRRVLLLIVVSLNNLDIEASRCQRLCSFLHNLQKEIDADRHIGGAKNGRLSAVLLQSFNLFIGKSCRAHHNRRLCLDRIVHQPVKCLR